MFARLLAAVVFAGIGLGAFPDSPDFELADRLTSQGRFADALAILEPLTRQPDRRLQARAWGLVGALRLRQGKIDDAALAFETRLKLETEAENAPGIASARNSLGIAFRRKGDLIQAQRLFETVREEASRLNDERLLAQVNSNLGDVQATLGEFSSARESYQRSLDHGKKLTDREPYAITLFRSGEMERFLGNLDDAERRFEEFSALAETLPDPGLRAAAAAAFGYLHRTRHRYSQALSYLERGLAGFEKIGRKLATAELQTEIGYTYHLQGDYDQALLRYRRALAVYEPAGLKQFIANTRHRLGVTQLDSGRVPDAIETLESARRLFVETGQKESAAMVQGHLGSAWLQSGNLARARKYLEEALQDPVFAGSEMNLRQVLLLLLELDLRTGRLAEAEETGRRLRELLDRNPEAASPLAGAALGLLAWRQGRVAEAETALRLAVEGAERLREASIDTPGARAVVLQSVLLPYVRLAELLVSQQRHEEALQVSEQAKARSLRDLVERGPDDWLANLTSEERGKERLLRERISSLRRKSSPAEAVRQARLDYEAFLASLSASHPGARGLHAVAVRFHRGMAPAGGALEYLVAEDSVLLFRASPRAVRAWRIPVTPSALRSQVAAFRNAIASRAPGFQEQSSRLYKLLLAPAGPLPARLRIVPDDALWELPFHALAGAAGHYVIKTTEISLAPSLVALGPAAAPTGSGTLLVAGAAVPGSETHLRRLAALTPGARILEGQSAREADVKAALPGYGLVHFSTHGFLDPQNGLYSRLQLLPGVPGKDDGWLEAWEITRTRLAAKLVVLAACDSGRGEVARGEGMIGLGWALFAAGARNVIASQWRVESEGTAALFERFYRALNTGRTASASLRAASLQLLETREFRHPFYWAGFLPVSRGAN